MSRYGRIRVKSAAAQDDRDGSPTFGKWQAVVEWRVDDGPRTSIGSEEFFETEAEARELADAEAKSIGDELVAKLSGGNTLGPTRSLRVHNGGKA